jgi:hypothetical protein
MGGRVSNDLNAVGILVGDDRKLCILLDQMGGIDHLAIHLAGQGGSGKTGAYAHCDIGDCDGLFETALRTIRQSDDWHVFAS